MARKKPIASAEPKPWDRERRLYQFTCARCGKSHRQTVKRRKARETLCRKCRIERPDDRQMTLIDETK